MLIYSKYYLAKKYDLEGNKRSIFWKEELKELKLRYTSLQTYRLLMKEFPFLSLLKKNQLDAVKCVKSLK